ncbi:MAG: hypothetical protein D6798_01600 [Deltaproteobacteria bacterium]|nr:MAG: hypothetical protein D6798_01600 [Deltaproteobacteria bacterium]
MELVAALLMFAMQFAIMIGFFLIVVVFAMKVRQAHARKWEQFANRHGLQFVPPTALGRPEIRGDYDGVPIRLETVSRNAGNNKVTYTVANAAIQAPLPAGFSISREGLGSALSKLLGGQDIQVGDEKLDRRFRFKGCCTDEVRRAMTDVRVQKALHEMLGMASSSRVQAGVVIVERRGTRHGPELEQMLEVATRLSRALATAFREPWVLLAQDRGLDLDETGAATVLKGRVDGIGSEGVPVSIRVRRGPEHVGTHLRVGLPRPLPGKLTLFLKEEGKEGGGIGLGDLVLDTAVQAAAIDPDAGRRLVAAADPADDIHGLLLGLLHGHPGSRVTATEIVLIDSRVDPVLAGEWLDECLALAAALGRAAERAELSQAVARGRGHLAQREERAFGDRGDRPDPRPVGEPVEG